MASKYIYKRKRRADNQKTHVLLILITLIFLVNKINEAEWKATRNFNPNSDTLHKYQNLGLLNAELKLRKGNQLMKKSSNLQKSLILLQILLSNDIHPNPGPKPVNTDEEICTACKENISKEDSLQCSSCNGWCHISCLGNSNKNSFQWICPIQRCSPNLGQGTQLNSQLTSPNRFKPLENSEGLEERKLLKPMNKFLNELPIISTKDYIGKDLCTGCYKEVKSTQQAISCDLCQRWMHRICSDMSTVLYNQCRKKKHFTWTCTKCRIEETLNKDKVDLSKFNEANLPDTYSTVMKSNKELLILNMNCRSINNKQEELEAIVQSLDPDVICLTETWMDDSVPSQANIPDGYSIIRKDRSDAFKQKYGRNKGGGVAILHKKHIKVEKKTYLTDRIEEILWVHVKVKESFMLGVIYRAEYSELLQDDEETKIEENIRKACEITNNLIITGDFNIDMADQGNKNTQMLSNIYTSYGLTQHINKATRIDKNTLTPTIIDHIWSNTDTKLIQSSGTFTGLSDHMGIYMKLNRSKPVPPKTLVTYRGIMLLCPPKKGNC